MNTEARLLSKVLMDKNMRSCLDARINPDFFQDEAHGVLYSWFIDFFGKYGTTPTAGALKRNHPWFKVVEAPEEMSWYIDQLMAAREYAVLHDALIEAGAFMKQKETVKARQVMTECMSLLATDLSPMRDMNLADPDTLAAWWTDYEELESQDGALRGLPTGFPTLDRATSGYQPEQLVTIIGFSKAGKSTGLMLGFKAVHDAGSSPLFVGFEMSNEEQRARYACMKAHINWHRLWNGKLNRDEKTRFKKALHDLENTPDLWLVSDPSATATISGIQAKLDTYTPSSLFIDGIYLMMDEVSGEQNTSTALTNITRNLKRLAQRYRIPIVGTTQALEWKTTKKKGLTTNAIGYTSSFAQDSDVIVGLESTDDEDRKLLKVVAARNLRNMVVEINWDWDTGQFEEMESAPDYDNDEAVTA